MGNKPGCGDVAAVGVFVTISDSTDTAICSCGDGIIVSNENKLRNVSRGEIARCCVGRTFTVGCTNAFGWVARVPRNA